MASSSKSSATKNYDDVDEIEMVSEKIVKRSNRNTQQEEEDDGVEVVFVREINSSQLNPKPSALTVEEYLGVRDGTILKILGRTARLNRSRRKTSSLDARTPRVVTIG